VLDVSNLQPLVIQTGADWGWNLHITTSLGAPLVASNLEMEMRRDRSSLSQLLTRLDMSGTAPGLISPAGPGMWSLTLPDEVTTQIPTGRGFWDLFGVISGRRLEIAAGAVEVRPHVTMAAS